MNRKAAINHHGALTGAVLPVAVCIAAAVLARIVGILSSFFATDIIYEDSLINVILPYVPAVLQAVSFAAAATAAAHLMARNRKAIHVILLYSFTVLADAVAVVLYDGLSGYYAANFANTGVEFYTYIILYRLGIALFSVILFFVACAVMLYLITRKRSAVLAAAVGGVIPVAVDFIAVAVRSVSTAFEREFILLNSEIWAIVSDIGVILGTVAVAVGTSVGLSLLLRHSKDGRK